MPVTHLMVLENLGERIEIQNPWQSYVHAYNLPLLCEIVEILNRLLTSSTSIYCKHMIVHISI